jgi:hypothetical protein
MSQQQRPRATANAAELDLERMWHGSLGSELDYNIPARLRRSHSDVISTRNSNKSGHWFQSTIGGKLSIGT